jgi:hypothetical protein
MNKDKIRDYVLAIIIMIIPTMAIFLVMNFYIIPLDPVVFTIVLAGAYYSFCINIFKFAVKKDKGWKLFFEATLSLVVFPGASIYILSFLYPEILIKQTFYGIVLGGFTGFCWGIGFDYMIRHQ